MKASQITPSLQADRLTVVNLGLKPVISGQYRFTTSKGCPSCNGKLEFVANNGTKIKCLDCKASFVMADLTQPKATLSECPPEPLGGDSSHSTPAGDDSLISAVKTAEYEPPRVEPIELEIPAGVREPGSDDEPTATPATNFKRKPLRELAKQHPGTTPMLVRDYFPTKSIITVFGEPGSGKTTLVTDVVASIDMGFD